MKKSFVKGAAVMMAAMTMLTGCGSKTTDSTQTTSAADTTAEGTSTTEAASADTTTSDAATAEVKQSFDKLTLEFVPSKDADVIITGTAELPQLVKDEMAKLGYDIGEVHI